MISDNMAADEGGRPSRHGAGRELSAALTERAKKLPDRAERDSDREASGARRCVWVVSGE